MSQSRIQSIYFVDANLPDLSALLAALPAEADVVLLQPGEDGLQQMLTAMAGNSDIDAVHVLTHGAPGTIQLGSTTLDATSLEASAESLQALGEHLSVEADLLFYGCDVAASDEGKALVAQIAELTGADVAASEDVTGAGGDWELEATVGVIEAAGIAAYDFDGTLALPGARSATQGSEVFLGGNYIELGISAVGSFGTSGNKPSGFFGTSRDSRVGMSNDADGFDTGTDLRIDYFLPGSPEERWAIGYNGSQYGGYSNLSGKSGVALTDNSVSNNSSGDTLSATFTATAGGTLDVQQVHTFKADDKFFKTTVTLTNTTGSTLTDVRFMRSFDPDNTVYMGGSYGTVNKVENTHAAGDGKAVVSATSQSDSYSSTAGSTAKILFFSSDPRAYVANFGFSNSNPYAAPEQAKGYTTSSDSAIAIIFKAGTLAAGDSVTFEYYTSLDTANIEDTIAAIEAASNPAPTFTAFDAPVDSIYEDTQVEITLGDLKAQGNEADQEPIPEDELTDGGPTLREGSVDAFVVTSVTSGTLLIGADAGSATAWIPGVNDVIDASHHAYWTPSANANGVLNAFKVVAQDSDGLKSSSPVEAQVTVNAVNDAPVIASAATDIAVPAINEDQVTINGASVADLVGPRFTDVDAGASFGGILVVADTSTAGQGVWQYSTDNGVNWYAIGPVAADSALALDPSAKLRFVPEPDWNGEPGALSVRVTDNEYTGSYTSGVTKELETNTSASGVSDNTVNIKTNVNSINDVPVFTSVAGEATLTETSVYDDALDTGKVEVSSGSLTGTLTGDDVEDGSEGVSFTIRGGSEAAGTVTKTGFYGTLTLNTSTNEWQYTPTNFTAINALAQGVTATETFEFKVVDTEGASTTQELTISLQGTNDLPQLSAEIADQEFNGNGTWVYQIPSATFTDAEGLALSYTVEIVDGGGNTIDTIGAIVGAGTVSSWMIFDADSRTLSGNPTPLQLANLPLDIKVTATDSEGEIVSDTFTLTLNELASDANPVAPNVAPTSTNDQVYVADGVPQALTADDFGVFDDADADALAAVKITALPGSGSLEWNSDGVGSWQPVTDEQVISKADIDAGNLRYTGSSLDSLTFQVSDGAAYSGDYTLTLAVDESAVSAGVTFAASDVTTAIENQWTSVYNDDPLTGFTGNVRVVVSATDGNIRLNAANDAGSGITSITTGYGDAYNGTATSIAFEGTLVEVNAALQLLEANLAENPSMTLDISAIKGGATYNPDNGHYYEVVSSAGVSWTDAKTAAEGMTFNGLNGYLATITSVEENAFILSKLPSDAWIGASDSHEEINAATGEATYADDGAAEGNWYWVTGPEKGTLISTGNDAPVVAGGQYANWNTGEPNDSGSDEDYAEFYASGASPGRWNDLSGASLDAYVVEYGGDGGIVEEEASRTITLTAQSPDPVLNLSGNAAYTENATPKALNPTLSITDIDSATLASATVAITAGSVAGDTLAFDNDNGATYGNILSVFNAGTLTLSSAGDTATLDQWEAALQAVTFFSSSEDPGAIRTIQWQVTDPDGHTSEVASTTIAVTEVNDAPVAAALDDQTATAGQPFNLNVSGTFTDPEGDDITYSAKLEDGSDLPSWLTFDAGTQTFSGNPPAGVPYLNIRVIGTDTGGAEGSTTFTLNLADASGAAAANNSPDPFTITDSNGGAIALGDTITATAPVDNDGYNPANLSYQWQVSSDGGTSWVDIDGAASNSYTITQDESGKMLRAQAFYTDNGGFAEAPLSNELAVPTFNIDGSASITGSTIPGQTLVATLSDGNGISSSAPTYKWYRADDAGGAGKTEIGGATLSSYTLTNDDGGKYITVEISYTDDEGTAETVEDTSAQIMLGATPPAAVNDTGTAEEAGGIDNADGGSNATGNVLTNDTDENPGDTKTVTALRSGNTEGLGNPALPDGSGGFSVSGDYGTLSVAADGSYTYQVNQFNFSVEKMLPGDTLVDSFNYTVTDGTGLTDIGVLDITIEGANDAPSVRDVPTEFHVTEDVQSYLSFPVPFSMTDPDSPTDEIFSIELSVSQGKLWANSIDGDGVTVTGGDGSTGTVTLSGELGDLNTYFDSDNISFLADTPHLNVNDVTGAVELTMTLEDAGGNIIDISPSPIDVIIDPVNDIPTGVPTLQGTIEEGKFVYAIVDEIADDDGLGSFSYQWFADDVAIDGANKSFILLGQSQVFKSIRVEVSYTDEDGTREVLSSEASAPVVAVNDVPTGRVLIEGTPSQGEQLTASNNIRDDDGMGPVTYQWLRNGEVIEGATGTTYTLTQADVGNDISVMASYVDGEGTNESVTSSTLAIANVNDAPEGGVTISGTPAQGETLSAANDLSDADGMGEVNYQWLRDGAVIEGATGGSYTLTQEDVDTDISVQASYTDGQGTDESVTSNTLTINNVNDAPEGGVTISGTPAQDETLSAANDLSDADGMGDVSYQWLRDGEVIGGATGGTYTLTEADVGSEISVRASYTDGQGTEESVTSNTLTINNVNDAPEGGVTISGTPAQGETLSAANDLSDADGMGEVNYQWLRDGAVIEGATGGSYTLTQEDVDTDISVQASYTDGQGTDESVTSNTLTINNVNDAPEGGVTISGTPAQDETLSAANDLSDADGMGDVSYQWLRDGEVIGGATGGTYTLTEADVGSEISVVASYTDGGGTEESATSTPVVVEEVGNQDPVFGSGMTFAVNEDEILEGMLSATDPEGDELVFSLVEGPTNGTLTLSESGGYVYTPGLNYNGSDSFVAKVSDGSGGESVATFTIDVNAVDDELEVFSDAPDQIRTRLGQTSTIDMASIFKDVDGDDLTYSYSVDPDGDLPEWITFNEDGSVIVTAPTEGANERVTLTLTAVDQNGNSISHELDFMAIRVLTVDGMEVEQDASLNRTDLDIQPVPVDREEDPETDNETLADIPLFSPENPEQSETLVSVPVGVGISARSGNGAVPRDQAIGDLITYIKETTEEDDADRDELVGGGESFLGSLPETENLLVSRITLTSNGEVPSQPIRITSRTNNADEGDTDTVPEAFVIDVRQLPSGSVIELDGIEFAVIVGDATVTGGNGRNIVYGNEGNQVIILGEDDDELYGGSGDDTVGSKGGDDLIFGEAGDDIVFGGAGNDIVHGGLGNDVATFEGSLDDYTVLFNNASVTVTSKTDETDINHVINAEALRFADQEVSVVFDPVTETFAWLYGSVLGRQADLGGIEFYVGRYLDEGIALGGIALEMLRSQEFTDSNGAVAFDQIETIGEMVETLYEHLHGRASDSEGFAHWVSELESGTSIEAVVGEFMHSEEMQLNGVIIDTGWSFFL
jgi:VCBS repeat-containing protein